MSESPPRSRTLALLGLVVAAALALRLTGLDHELPQRPDEDSLIVTQAESLRGILAGDPHAPDLEPHYPLVLATTLALWPLPEHDARREREAPLTYHLERASRPYVRGRLVVALLATLAVPLAWLVARRFVGERWALLTAALVAISLLHLRLSQSARPHAVLASWILLALWLDLRLLERGRWRDHALAGMGTALALGCLHNGASAFLPLGFAQIARLRADGLRSLPRAVLAWALVAAIGALAYFASLSAGANQGLSTSGDSVTLSGHEFPLSVFDGGGFARMGPLLAQSDPLLLAAGLAGLAVLLVRLLRSRARPAPSVLLLCSWALPYTLVMGLYSRLPARFLLPLVPLLALSATAAVATLSRGRPASVAWRRAAALAVVLLLALPGYACARLAWLWSRPESAEETARWLERNADRERDLLYLSASANLPLFAREEGGGRLFAAPFSWWDEYQSLLPQDLLQRHAWRTRRLLAGDSRDLSTVRQDERAVREVLERSAFEPTRRRLAVVALNPATGAGESAQRALLDAGATEIWRCDVLSRACATSGLTLDAGGSLRQLLFTRRLGLATVVYELPPDTSAGSVPLSVGAGVSSK